MMIRIIRRASHREYTVYTIYFTRKKRTMSSTVTNRTLQDNFSSMLIEEFKLMDGK